MMTGAVLAASRSTRAVRATIPSRALGGWNFDSGSSNPSLGAVSRSRPDITLTTGDCRRILQNVLQGQCHINAKLPSWPRGRMLASELWVNVRRISLELEPISSRKKGTWRPDRPRRRELTNIPLGSRTQSGLLRRHDYQPFRPRRDKPITQPAGMSIVATERNPSHSGIVRLGSRTQAPQSRARNSNRPSDLE